MSAEIEEFKFEIMEDLTRPYRFSPKAQVAYFILIVLGVILGVSYLPLSLELKIASVIFVTALIYPFIIKVVNVIVESVGMALYAGAMFALVYLLINYLTLNNIRNVALLVIFLEVIGIEMLHHIMERFRIERGGKTYLITGILSVIFFIASLYVFLPIGILYAALLSAVLTIVFVYAILPERPF